MSDSDRQTQPSDSTMIRFWQRIPVVIRAIILGFFVFAIAGSVARTVILALIPAPWSIVVMGGVLWIYCKYFSGSWWSKSTVEARRDNFRAAQAATEAERWAASSSY